jgi:hypothetical protein
MMIHQILVVQNCQFTTELTRHVMVTIECHIEHWIRKNPSNHPEKLKLSTVLAIFHRSLHGPCASHGCVWGSGSTASFIHWLYHKKKKWVISFLPQPLHPRGRGPRYPKKRRLGRPKGRSGQFKWDKNFFTHADNRTKIPQTWSP